MELSDYLTVLRRRWRALLACLAAALAVAAVITWQTTPTYASTAKLFVSTQEADISNAYQGGLLAGQRIASYADMVTDRDIAERVDRSLGGDFDPDQLSDQVSARVVPETLNLEITATDTDPARARDIAQAYAESLSRLITELESPPGRVQSTINASIIQDAEVATQPASPRPVRNMLFATGAGLLLGIGFAMARELLDRSLVSADDIAEITSSPILGSIDSDSPSARLDPATSVSSATPWGEAFRVLRTNMQYVEVDHDRRAFVVTSPAAGDGKSTVALNLAVTMAVAGRRVVLVEADLRRPEIARRLAIDSAVGTTSVLIGQAPLHDALQVYGETGLQVLPCGPIPPNPSEMLQSTAMTKLLTELREKFDVVIIDAPPLLPVTDAALLTAQADGALLVVRHGKTSSDDLDEAVDRIAAVGGNAVGVVVNMAPSNRSAHRYAYGDAAVAAGPAPTYTRSSRRTRRRRRSARRDPLEH